MVYHPKDRLSATFHALADPTRRALLARLAGGEASIVDLAGPFQMSLPAVSKHVRVLQRAGLAQVRRRGRSRHCRLVVRPMKEALQWMERYRRFWDEQFDRLQTFLNSQ
jgi:DNA-binding transcriptional ArsR family regulator